MTLAEETHQREEAEKAKTNLAVELTAFREQMEKAKANVVVDLCVSQSLFDMCGVYYGVGFDDCLKQVEAAYPISYGLNSFLSSPLS